MVELLSPAGNYDKMVFAFQYGADAVYGGLKSFSLREQATNFSLEELYKATQYAHSLNKKFYLASNIFFHNEDIDKFLEILPEIKNTNIDGIIMTDIGIINLIREKYPELNIHISTQANTLNYLTAKYYEKIGIKRIILARELSIEEIKRIRDSVNIELECFVHGAICVSYSGRCLLSNYFTNPNVIDLNNIPKSMKKIKNRDANRGDCAQPCRWNYYLVEENRLNEYFPIVEDERGTTILSSKDLNMARYMKELINAGVNSFKIEGRMKSIYYVANTTRVYRKAIDLAQKNKTIDDIYLKELYTISHREYFTGFYFNPERKKLLEVQTYNKSYIKEYIFLAYVKEKLSANKYLCLAMNKLTDKEKYIEYISPDYSDGIIKNYNLYIDNTKVEKVQPNTEFILETDEKLNKYFILRKPEM